LEGGKRRKKIPHLRKGLNKMERNRRKTEDNEKRMGADRREPRIGGRAARIPKFLNWFKGGLPQH